MNTLSNILLFTSLFDIVFSFIIFVKARNTERELALQYFILFAVIGIWELSMWAAFFVHLAQVYDFIIHAASYALGIMSFFHLLLFVWVLSGKKYVSRTVMMSLGFIVYFIATVTFIPDVIILYTGNAGAQSAPGPLMALFYLMLVPMFLGIVYLTVKGTRSSQDQLAKKRMRLIGLGVIIVVCCNTFSSVLLPYYYKIVRSEIIFVDSGWVATQQVISVILLSILSFVTAYAITRYRFMNIRLEFKQRFAYSVVISFVFIVLMLLGEIAITTFGAIESIGFVVLCSFLYFSFIDKRVRFFLDSIFFLEKLDPSKAFTYDERKFDSYKTIIPWIDELGDRFKECQVEFVAAYTLQRQHNRLTNPKTNKHIWHSSEFIQELMIRENGLYIQDSFGCSFPRAIKKTDAVVSVQHKSHVQAVFFLQLNTDMIDGMSQMIPQLAREAIFEVQYYEAVEGSKKTVKELIYNERK